MKEKTLFIDGVPR